VEITLVVELDNHLARASRGTGIDVDASAEDALQLVECGSRVGVESGGLGRGAMLASARGQALDVADGQIAASGALGGFHSQRRVFNGEKRARMARGEAAVFDHFADWIFEAQKAEGIRDGYTFLAGALGGFLLREVKFLNQAIESLRLLDGIQVFALQVFDQRDFHGFLVGNIVNDDGNAVHRDKLCGAPAAFAGEELISRGAFANDERLDDAGAANRLRQFVERGLGETRARLVGTGVDKVDVDLEDRSKRFGGARGRDGSGSAGNWSRRRIGRWAIRRSRRRCFGLAYQRAQPLPQCVSGH